MTDCRAWARALATRTQPQWPAVAESTAQRPSVWRRQHDRGPANYDQGERQKLAGAELAPGIAPNTGKRQDADERYQRAGTEPQTFPKSERKANDCYRQHHAQHHNCAKADDPRDFCLDPINGLRGGNPLQIVTPCARFLCSVGPNRHAVPCDVTLMAWHTSMMRKVQCDRGRIWPAILPRRSHQRLYQHWNQVLFDRSLSVSNWCWF